MRESFEYEGTTTGEFRSGMYATYAGKEYPAVYLGYGRFILYSTTADENFTFPTQDGRYLLQTDMRDSQLTRASEIRMVGIVKDCFENVMIRNIFEEGVVISTYNPRLAFQLGLEPVRESGFTGLVDRNLLLGIYEEKDYLWNPALGIYTTLCQAVHKSDDQAWLVDQDRLTQFYVIEHKKQA